MTSNNMTTNTQQVIKDDCVEILCNIFEIRAEAKIYISELDSMLRKQVSEDKIYKWLHKISEAEYAREEI